MFEMVQKPANNGWRAILNRHPVDRETADRGRERQQQGQLIAVRPGRRLGDGSAWARCKGN